MSVPKIVEVTYAIYHGLDKRRLSKEYVGRKLNSSKFNLQRNFDFACTTSFSPKVITWLEPEIDGLPNFLRYGAALAHVLRAGAPLSLVEFCLYTNANTKL